jgi:hypothetical protein
MNRNSMAPSSTIKLEGAMPYLSFNSGFQARIALSSGHDISCPYKVLYSMQVKMTINQ